MKVLAIGAHPDDLEYGCGGTLIRHSGSGDEVFLLMVTDGSMGGEPDTRGREQRDAAKILGAKETFFCGYADTRFECNRDSIMKLEEHIEAVGPDVVYTHWGDDTHQDHRHISQAVVPAARSVPNLLFFEALSSRRFSPSLFVNIGDVINQKLASLEAHASQMQKTNIENMSILDIARSTANFRGIQGRVTYAEGFAAVRYFVQFS